MTAVSTPGTAPRPRSHARSRLRARIVLAGLAACGLAALAWASFVHPLPRLIYNPSDSVPVGWYRVEPLQPRAGSLPRPLSVDSIVLVRLPADATALAAQRGYLPAHIPLLKRVGAVAPQHVCIVAGQVRIDGVPVAKMCIRDRCVSVPLNECTNPHRRIGEFVRKHLCASTPSSRARVHSGVRP